VLGAVLALLLCCYTGYLALAFGLYRAFVPSHAMWGYARWAWLAASLVHLGLLTFFLGTMYHWSGNPRRNALAFPVAGSMLLAIFFKALKMCVTKKVEWRGTSYSHVMADTLGTPAHGAKAG